ncbi:conserved hypothetical protein [Chlamydia pneumoniae LPCoLN]|uniref:hypothetical protein n=1 Tax=Chlamydia pneumoniae TaxID=83558 RepID=UPI0001BD9C7D|nr:hypothetical protein [Chlamydia pneumoniae]ACZ32743.1 conserved hypothetical protein [Chlamydia pneumoniae LPCoLN]ETR79612.1 hypothetical protein X556_1061 [Chlamydia pneumoniae B21]
MRDRLGSLSLILKVKIHKYLDTLHNQKRLALTVSRNIQATNKRIADLHLERYEHFISRDNIKHYDVLLEYLKTLQSSLYKQQSESLRFLEIHHQQLQELINRRKIIEKIKNNKYSKDQEIGT